MFNFKVFTLLLTLLLSSMSGVWATDMVVIHSNSETTPPSYPKGSILENATPIVLKPAEEVTVVFSSGGVKTVVGPHDGVVLDPLPQNTQDPNLLDTLSALVQTKPVIVRGQQVPHNLWLIDVSTNKRYYCINNNRRITLWRPERDSKTASRLFIKHKPSGKRAQTMWPANRTTLSWPRAMPISYGETYTMELKTLNGRSTFKKLVLYKMPSGLPTKSHQVVWMVGKGCIPQANRLLAELR